MKKNNDPYAPNSEIFINDIKMNDDFMSMVPDIVVDDNHDLISSLNFKVNYQKNIKGGVSNDFLDMKFLSPGNLVVVKVGYGTDLVAVGAGYVTDLDPDFPHNSEPSVKITCYDKLHGLSVDKSEKGETFKDWRDSQICSIIAERHGFYIRNTDRSTFSGIRKSKFKKIRVQKRGTTDLDFLKELAKLNSYDLYSRWDAKLKRFAIYFEPPKDRTKDIVEYIYGDGDAPYNMAEEFGVLTGILKSFKPKFTVGSQFTRYKVVAYDKKAERKIEYSLSMSEFMAGQEDLKLGGIKSEKLLKKNAATSGAGVRKKAFGDNTEVISKKTFNNEIDAKEFLTNHMKKLAKTFITGTASVSGNQYLQSRQIITLKGIGSFFNGKYFINKATHKISNNNYTTELSVRKVIKEEV